jgi:hypothetical protein
MGISVREALINFVRPELVEGQLIPGVDFRAGRSRFDKLTTNGWD